MSKRVHGNPAGPHPFITHFIEPLRESLSPLETANRLRLWKIETLRAIGDEPTEDVALKVSEHGGDRHIRIDLQRALNLVDQYIDLYEQESLIRHKSTVRASSESTYKSRINWTGTYIQFKGLLTRLAEADLIDKKSAAVYAQAFADHFLKNATCSNPATIRSSTRDGNYLKGDDVNELDDIVDSLDK